VKTSNYKNIVIEGNIGAGKTTLTKALSARLEARLILETFKNNPFLAQFYSDRDRYGFQVELFFLAERYHQLSKNLLGDIFQEYTVYDYHFSKCAIFSSINLLHEDERALYNNLFSIMDRFMPQPDILIYLHQSIETLQAQILNRGRNFEQEIPNEYLEAVSAGYFASFKEVTSFPIVVINLSEGESVSANDLLDKASWIVNQEWKPGINHISMHL
jgi:deoxyguanosine kinase